MKLTKYIYKIIFKKNIYVANFRNNIQLNLKGAYIWLDLMKLHV